MTNFKKTAMLVLLALGSNTFASSELTYVPELTGLYNIGDIADINFNSSFAQSGLIPATYKESNVAFNWNGPIPNYLTYELSGYIQLPVLIDPANQNNLNNADINFNGRFIFTPNPGISWGTTLNQNMPIGNGVTKFDQSFDPTTGAFYFGMIFDIASGYNNACCSAFGGSSSISNPSANIYAVFYNYNMDFTNQYVSRGNVFVESARVGLSSNFSAPSSNPPMNVIIQAPDYMIRAVPIPAAVWLFGSGLIGLLSVTRRKSLTKLSYAKLGI